MKLQNDNFAYVSVLKDALENLNKQKSTSRRIQSGMLLENSEHSELKPKSFSSNIAWSSCQGAVDNFTGAIKFNLMMAF